MAQLKEVKDALKSLSGEEKIVAEWAYEFSKSHLPEKNTKGYYKARIGDEPTVHLVSHIIRGLTGLGNIAPYLDKNSISDAWMHDLNLSAELADKIFIGFSPEKDLKITI
tara:strand:+ start:196 stop:525 length:330 start_codon:yes stop_codon:yes gene_type:complete